MKTIPSDSTYVVGPQYPVTTNRPPSPKNKRKPEYYKQQTEELNKCFDDIEQFVRYIEGVTNYTKSLDRNSARRKDKKSNGSFFENQFLSTVRVDLLF